MIQKGLSVKISQNFKFSDRPRLVFQNSFQNSMFSQSKSDKQDFGTNKGWVLGLVGQFFPFVVLILQMFSNPYWLTYYCNPKS